MKRVPRLRSTDEETGARSPRLRHPGRIIGVFVVISAVLASGFVAGQLVRSPSDEALANVSETVAVVAPVELRVVDNGFQLPAQLIPAATSDVSISEASEESSSRPRAVGEKEEQPATPLAPVTTIDRVVLSRAGIQVGAKSSYGALLGEVSGRPLFAWPQDDPLFRDIRPGDKGSDVRAVQETLAALNYRGVRVSGIFDQVTVDALSRLYAAAGYSLPFVSDGVRGLAWRELAPLPDESGVVVWVAPVGSILGAESPLLRLQISAPTLRVQATAIELEGLAVGAEVGVVSTNAQPTRSTVQAVGVFATDEATGASGYSVTVAIPEGLVIDGSSPIQVQPWARPAPTSAVPAVAVRQDGKDTYVLVPSKSSTRSGSESKSLFDRVEVTVLAQSDGWVAIEPNGHLKVGQEVLVSE